MKDTEIFLKELLKKNDVIVVGCSGGPDSLCLLHVLKSLSSELKLKIICAHVNHGLRKESDIEAVLVQNFCDANDIIFEYEKIAGYKDKHFTEQEGREKRYHFFEKLIKKYDAKYLMTAHHGDDLIETILMRIVRGSNLKGYAGITSISENDDYSIVRPLLNLSKKEIMDYVIINGIEYAVDNSNNDEKYTRNRFRKHMLPFLKNENIKVHLKFLEFSKELEESQKYINRVIKSKISEIYVENYIIINKISKEDEYLQEKIVQYVIEDIQRKNVFNISDSQFNNLMKLISCNRNKQINLADGFIARKSYDKLYIEKVAKANEEYEYIFEQELDVLNKYHFTKCLETSEKSNFVTRLNSNEIKLPLIVRSKREGDKMQVKNLKGTKKISDIFTNSKIDSNKRCGYPIVTDSNGTIIWVPGLKKSIFDKDINEKYDIIIKYGGKYE